MPEHYFVGAYENNCDAIELLSQNGFNVKPIKKNSQPGKKPYQLDRMGIYRSGKYVSTQYDYAALILLRNSEGLIRNRYELAIVFLVLGVLQLTD